MGKEHKSLRDEMANMPLGAHSANVDNRFLIWQENMEKKQKEYKPPRGFLVPKFTMYDRSSDSFDHLMHFWHMMTLDIGNDLLLCKVFPTNLHGPTLSWFHRLPQNSINSFQDVSEAFVGYYLCYTRQKKEY